jgi:hypothetical protein
MTLDASKRNRWTAGWAQVVATIDEWRTLGLTFRPRTGQRTSRSRGLSRPGMSGDFA